MKEHFEQLRFFHLQLSFMANRKHSTKECHQIVKLHKGNFLSKEYKGVHARHNWKCKEGHQFSATFNSVYRGSWCKSCSQHRAAMKWTVSLDEWQRRGSKMGLKIFKMIHERKKHTILVVQCLKNPKHIFEMDSNSVKNGRGCKFCAKNVRLEIDHAHKLATERGGECLSKSYSTAKTKLRWQCGFKHQPWMATYDHVRQGTWCPECSRGLGERICRAYFEQLFDVKFPPGYPTWLRNEKGNQLELDGYSSVLQLAFEHQGEYHYSTRGYLAKNDEELIYRQRIDTLKRNLCLKNGVILIEIKEIPKFQKIETLQKIIEEKCIFAGVQLPKKFYTKQVLLLEAYKPDFLKELREICGLRKGRLLSKVYLGARYKHQFQCDCGNTWWTTPDSVKRGSWCRLCGYKKMISTRKINNSVGSK